VRLINNPQKPSFSEEKKLKAHGYRLIAGIDESGRGSLAGPVVAAAVVLPGSVDAPWWDRVNDSKQLSSAVREQLSTGIRQVAISVGVGVIGHEIIDAWGIVTATRLAMTQAIDQLSPAPDYLLIDFMSLPDVSLPQRGIVGGDCRCFSIACASIIAKVTRDRLMTEFDRNYPGYGLARHKGYGTEVHLSCLRRLGPCPIHRQSFRPVKNITQRLIRNLSP